MYIYTHTNDVCVHTDTHTCIYKNKGRAHCKIFFQVFAESLQVIAPTDQISEVEF